MPDDVRAYALRLLAQRSYTTSGLRQKLLRKEFSAEDTDAALERFTQSGLLDDKKFALSFARARLTATSASPRRVRQLLGQKGIAAPIADEAIAQVIIDEEIDPTVSMEKVARRKFAALSGDPLKVRQKLFGFLCRRGYDIDDVKRIVDLIAR